MKNEFYRLSKSDFKEFIKHHPPVFSPVPRKDDTELKSFMFCGSVCCEDCKLKDTCESLGTIPVIPERILNTFLEDYPEYVI